MSLSLQCNLMFKVKGHVKRSTTNVTKEDVDHPTDWVMMCDLHCFLCKGFYSLQHRYCFLLARIVFT